MARKAETATGDGHEGEKKAPKVSITQQRDAELTAEIISVLSGVSVSAMDVIAFRREEQERQKEPVKKAIAEVSFDGLRLRDLSIELRGQKHIVLAAVRNNGDALQYASNELKDDKEVVLAAFCKTPSSFRYASERLRGDKETVLEAMRYNVNVIQYANPELRDDEDVMYAVVCRNACLLSMASERLKNNKRLVRKALENNCWAFEHASKALRSDKDLIRDLVKTGGRASAIIFQWVDPSVWEDLDFIRQMVSVNPDIYRFVPKDLKGNRDMARQVCINNPKDLWKEVPRTLQDDLDFLLEIAAQNGEIYIWIRGPHRSNRELIKAAVANCPKAAGHLPAKLARDRQFMIELMEINGLALEHLVGDFKYSDKKIILAAVKQNPQALQNMQSKLTHEIKEIPERKAK